MSDESGFELPLDISFNLNGKNYWFYDIENEEAQKILNGN
jgi:hypothetical protein